MRNLVQSRTARLRPVLVAAASLVIAAAGCGDAVSTTPPATAATATPGGSPAPASPGPSASPGAGPTTGPLDLRSLAITLEPFASVPGGPLAMAAPDDGSGRLFVAAQDGKVWVVEADGRLLDTPMIDLGRRITSGGERGLLGIALHPDFPTAPHVFVDYTDGNGDTVVARLTLDEDDPNRLDPDSHRQVLFVDQPFANHNGGALAFGRDGYLYVSLGDGGSGGDPQDNGQRLDTLLGKILRVDIDRQGGGAAYTIPDDNPYASGGGLPEIWHSGLRNPWRMSFDRATDDLWIGDVGQNAWEEIDVAPAGAGGLNFGWRVMEGSHCFRADKCHQDGLTMPVSDYGRDLGCTVIGGYVYRGAAYPFLDGAYLFADYCSGNLFALDAGVRSLAPPTIVGSGSNGIAAFGQDAAGELYALALDGTVSRVAAAQR